jgi:hypothetical protein
VLTGAVTLPARLSRIGFITPDEALPLAAAAALDLAVRWRVVLTTADGEALATEPVYRRRRGGGKQLAGAGVVGLVTVTVAEATLGMASGEASGSDGAARPGRAGRADAATLAPTLASALSDGRMADGRMADGRMDDGGAGLLTGIRRAAERAAARAREQRGGEGTGPQDRCSHAGAASGYRPSPRIREFVQARDQTCRNPSCRQPASRTDLDHTTAYHRNHSVFIV